MRTAIIGAGIAGLACADALRKAGLQPVLFEKAVGPGGRMAVERVQISRREISFDPGATHFTVRSKAFETLVRDWERRGLAAPWPSAGLHAWIGVPTMAAPLEDMARGHEGRFAMPITAITRQGASWAVHCEKQRFDFFDAVVLAIPAEQAAPLLSLHDFELARSAMSVSSRPVWSAMFAFESRVESLPDFVRGPAPIVYAVRNNSRPGRDPAEHWVVQADWSWSEAHLTSHASAVCAALHAGLGDLAGRVLPEPLFADARCWRLAQPSGSELGHLWNSDIRLGACGDWLSHGFVEHAWRSGRDLGDAIARDASPSEDERAES